MKFLNFKFLTQLIAWIKPSKYRNPYRDWFFIVCCSACIIFFCLALAAALYYEIDQGLIFKVAPTASSTPLKIDREEVESVSGYYDNQEKIIDDLITNKVTAVDPAL